MGDEAKVGQRGRGQLETLAESPGASPFSRALTALLDAVEARCRELPLEK